MEGAFWASTIDVAGPFAGTAAGILNMGSNLGGVLSTVLIPLLAHRLGWFSALGRGAVMAVLGASLWLGIRADRPFRPSATAEAL